MRASSLESSFAPVAQNANLREEPFYGEALSPFCFVEVTEHAAIAAASWAGRGDKEAADRAAVDAMRQALNRLSFQGTIVIGEGERDQAPMLFIGEQVGTGFDPGLDIAVDPLEGTTLCAKSMPDSLSILAVAPKGTLLNAPDVYMEKIAIGPGYPEGIIDLDKSPAENVQDIARAKGVSPKEITLLVLDRPRHDSLIHQCRALGTRIRFISDGDVAGNILTTNPLLTGVDLYMGTGGAPEGVLAASVLRCIGGQMQGRLILEKAEQRQRAANMGIRDFQKKYTIPSLVSSDVLVAATGVTSGSLVKGVTHSAHTICTETLLYSSYDGIIRRILSEYPTHKPL